MRCADSTKKWSAKTVSIIVAAIHDGLIFSHEVLADLSSMNALRLLEAAALETYEGADPGDSRKDRFFERVARFAGFSFHGLRRRSTLGLGPANGTQRQQAGATDQDSGKSRPATCHREKIG